MQVYTKKQKSYEVHKIFVSDVVSNIEQSQKINIKLNGALNGYELNPSVNITSSTASSNVTVNSILVKTIVLKNKSTCLTSAFSFYITVHKIRPVQEGFHDFPVQ